MYTPHTVTIYNVSQDENFRTVNNITVLRGVFLDATKGSNVTKSGLDNADAFNLYVPFAVNATDGVTGRRKTYLRPTEYRLAPIPNDYWTMEPGEECFFVKGHVVEPSLSFREMNAQYDAHRITKVDTKDFGTPDMQHWEAGGA